ncbi:ferritin-like domain-containing protein [Frankia sp. Cas4]|uniref:ferritin-like domain-containing protein n=1 Tax=Frankia sp. Cas4 TaxID=3073927 RepID=UPI002AD451CA|nr:ferritin-like domain-containing protein [Frankia sp. Cas4]
MSIFDLPRLHFTGAGTTQCPTGPRNGRLDLATNTALGADGTPFPRDRPPQEYDGPVGEHFAGNGHFAVDAVVSGVELRAGAVDHTDPVVGRCVDMWGHYNEYLQTTVNRARVFDVDPSSNWTTTLMVGQFGFGRAGRSHDTGYACTGTVHGFQPPRWHDLRRGGSVVHQFVVTRADLTWPDDGGGSPAVEILGSALRSGADGLVVQFALITPSTPCAPNAPKRWDLRGTIAPWRSTESRTYPAGRLLVPADRGRAPHILSVDLTAEDVTLNMITAIGPSLPSCDLELRTARTGRLVAEVSRQACVDAVRSGGVLRVPRASGSDGADDEALLVVSGHNGETVSREREVSLQVDDACLFLEHPRATDDPDHDVDVVFRSFVRGRPAPVETVWLRQFANPRALPLDPRAAQAEIVRLRRGDDADGWSSTCVTNTDENGVGRFTLRGAQAGSTRILLTADVGDLDVTGYDNDDALGFWSAAGHMSVRVLPDDWRLADRPQHEITFDLVYREVFAPYEFLYSFMREEVFSLADRCKVETYAKLIWQMCDPRNKPKTYYMPPTRDLSEPKARLLLGYLRAQQKPDETLSILPSADRSGRGMSGRGMSGRGMSGRGMSGRGIRTRAELVSALRGAVTLELAVMEQYLYAAYSVPTHGAGLEYVRRGDWTPQQRRLACGDGGETLDDGIRGTLITVAREEMIHFLLVDNILAAIGEPFHVPNVNFDTINAELPIAPDFSLERLDFGSIQRFILIEQPDGLVGDVRLGDRVGRPDPRPHTYSSLSELYGDIRQGLQDIPGLFLVEPGRGGGEHHLFLRESVNQRHPDYQLEVDDLASALFAIDIITEQGEGGALTDGAAQAKHCDKQSHYAAFRGVAALLRDAGWIPSYPVVRNPTVREGRTARQYVTDPEARDVMQLFNDAYFVMLQLMVQHFGAGHDTSLRRSRLMNTAIDVMTGVMRPLGELLVTMPSGLRGRTAGPSFELDAQPAFLSRPDVAMRAVALRLDAMAARAVTCPLVPARVAEMSAMLADQLRGN